MSELFSQTGGVRIGKGLFLAFNATWPFASLKVGPSDLTLSCLFQEWLFPKCSIRRLSRCGGGIRIEHTIKEYNEFIVFWTFRFPWLQQELEKRGYQVS